MSQRLETSRKAHLTVIFEINGNLIIEVEFTRISGIQITCIYAVILGLDI